MTADLRWMDYALRLGRRALGTTAENPNVGCVIVKDGALLGVGWTMPVGRPHAETQALEMAGAAARGATAYVTLEPCAHHGKTGPCAEALVAAGIARIVTAIEDPDPRTKGSGHRILRAAGIAVITGLCAAEATHDMAGFLTRIQKHRPYVILKLGISADGKIAQGPGQRTAITGPQTNARVHMLRAQCDGILVGMGTVIADDPDLTCRLPGLENRSPIRIVADGNTSMPAASKLWQTAENVPVILLSTIADRNHHGQIDLPSAMQSLAKQGLNSLLVEGGSRMARAFLDADLVDEVQLFQSNLVIGPQGVDAIHDYPLAKLEDSFAAIHKETLGTDTLTVYERR